MKFLKWLGLILAYFFVSVLPTHAQSNNKLFSSPPYRIGPGDVLEISVWKDESLTKQVTVLPDGRFSFPLIGQVVAEEKTEEVLQKELVKMLKRFIPDPELNVMVIKPNSTFIYVLGRVNRPGRYPISDKKVNVLQAIAVAGGCTAFAKKDQIKVFREEKSGRNMYRFNYDQVIKGKNIEQNFNLKRRDTIIVP